MDIVAFTFLLFIVFVGLLAVGRAQVAKGLNAPVANGAVLLSVATVVGVLAMGLLFRAL